MAKVATLWLITVAVLFIDGAVTTEPRASYSPPFISWSQSIESVQITVELPQCRGEPLALPVEGRVVTVVGESRLVVEYCCHRNPDVCHGMNASLRFAVAAKTTLICDDAAARTDGAAEWPSIVCRVDKSWPHVADRLFENATRWASWVRHDWSLDDSAVRRGGDDGTAETLTRPPWSLGRESASMPLLDEADELGILVRSNFELQRRLASIESDRDATLVVLPVYHWCRAVCGFSRRTFIRLARARAHSQQSDSATSWRSVTFVVVDLADVSLLRKYAAAISDGSLCSAFYCDWLLMRARSNGLEALGSAKHKWQVSSFNPSALSLHDSVQEIVSKLQRRFVEHVAASIGVRQIHCSHDGHITWREAFAAAGVAETAQSDGLMLVISDGASAAVWLDALSQLLPWLGVNGAPPADHDALARVLVNRVMNHVVVCAPPTALGEAEVFIVDVTAAHERNEPCLSASVGRLPLLQRTAAAARVLHNALLKVLPDGVTGLRDFYTDLLFRERGSPFAVFHYDGDGLSGTATDRCRMLRRVGDGATGQTGGSGWTTTADISSARFPWIVSTRPVAYPRFVEDVRWWMGATGATGGMRRRGDTTGCGGSPLLVLCRTDGGPACPPVVTGLLNGDHTSTVDELSCARSLHFSGDVQCTSFNRPALDALARTASSSWLLMVVGADWPPGINETRNDALRLNVTCLSNDYFTRGTSRNALDSALQELSRQVRARGCVGLLRVGGDGVGFNVGCFVRPWELLLAWQHHEGHAASSHLPPPCAAVSEYGPRQSEVEYYHDEVRFRRTVHTDALKRRIEHPPSFGCASHSAVVGVELHWVRHAASARCEPEDTTGEPEEEVLRLSVTGHRSDGTVFMNISVEEPLSVTRADLTERIAQFMPCWQEVLPRLRRGDSVIAACPPASAFGPDGVSALGIAPYEQVLFEFSDV